MSAIDVAKSFVSTTPQHGPPLYREPPNPSTQALPFHAAHKNLTEATFNITLPNSTDLECEVPIKNSHNPENLFISHMSNACITGNSIAQMNCFGYSSLQSADRHPFESQLEDTQDPIYMRDTCNKLFSRDSKSSTCASLTNIRGNCYTNNITSTCDYNKLAPKEVIGRFSHEIKQDIPLPKQTFNKHNQTLNVMSAERHSYQPQSAKLHRDPQHNHKYYIIETSPNLAKKSDVPENKMSLQKSTIHHVTIADTNVSIGAPHCSGDNSDLYKSSSESGHGTLFSCSTHDTKSLQLTYNRDITTLSHLDSSVDSDNSNCQYNNSRNTDGKEKRTSGINIEVMSNFTEVNDNFKNDESQVIDTHVEIESEIYLPVSPQPMTTVKISQASLKNEDLSASVLDYDSEANKSKCKFPSHLTNSTLGRTSVSKKVAANSLLAPCHWNGKGENTSTNNLNRSFFSCRKSHNSSFFKQPLVMPSDDDDNDYADPDCASTTTGLDAESLFDYQDELSSSLSLSTSTMDPSELSTIKRQLKGLENMYSEILHHLAVYNISGKTAFQGNDNVSNFRCKHVNGNLSALGAINSNSRSQMCLEKKKLFLDKRKGKDISHGSTNKRLQRLESHVVTLARSVAHLSSEMRTQHMIVQELEQIRKDVTLFNERFQLLRLAQYSPHTQNSMPSIDKQYHAQACWDGFHEDRRELLNPNRAKKLTKFFGHEPPLIRQFLKNLGYEKYATNFESEKIGIAELPYLNEEKLQKIGVPMGPRMRIMQEAHTYWQYNQFRMYIV